MWTKEGEDVTWDNLMESLNSIDQKDLADKVKEKLGQYYDQQKKVEEEKIEKDSQV